MYSRYTTARFQSPLYTEAFTSPLYNGEISVSFIYRGIHFAVIQRRDFSLFYIQRHLPRRCTTARSQSLYIQRHLPRRCTTARFQSLLYTEAFTSPLYNGEISASSIYRGIYLAVVQRRDFSLFIYRGIYLAVVQRRDLSLFIYRGIHFAVVQRRDFDI